MRKVWKAIKKMNGDPTSTVHQLKVNNDTKESKEEIVNTLASHFSKISSNENCSEAFLKHKEKKEEKVESMNI